MKDEPSGKYMEMPTAHYATLPFDKVVSGERIVGDSTYPAYTANEKAWISLAVIDDEHATFGSQVTVVTGEENGGSKKPVVERHVQKEIRATVSPWPYSKQAREHYRSNVPIVG